MESLEVVDAVKILFFLLLLILRMSNDVSANGSAVERVSQLDDRDLPFIFARVKVRADETRNVFFSLRSLEATLEACRDKLEDLICFCGLWRVRGLQASESPDYLWQRETRMKEAR